MKITGASPNPFFPWVDDDYKDETFVHFNLQAQADAEARVFKANSAGRCCGALIRNDDIGMNLAAGSHDWMWDGRGEVAHGTAGFRPKGRYFVKIRADEGSAPPATSKPFKVRIERTYRALATKTKPAQNYHHTSASVPIVIGGGCRVTKEPAYLKILCQGGHISVYWRWGLGTSERIERELRLRAAERGPPSIRHVGQHAARVVVHRARGPRRGQRQLPARHGEDHVQLPEGVPVRRRFAGLAYHLGHRDPDPRGDPRRAEGAAARPPRRRAPSRHDELADAIGTRTCLRGIRTSSAPG